MVIRGGHVPACGCRHHGLASTFSKCPVETVAMMEGEIVANKGLTTIFVDSLQDLCDRSAKILLGSLV